MEAKEFGEFLKQLRKNKKMTIRQLELYSKVSNAYISQLERGERNIPSPEILKKLSGGLGVSYADLMYAAGYVDEAEGMTAEMTNITDSINSLGDMKSLIDKYTDDEIIELYSHESRGKNMTEKQVRKILSYVRFVLSTEND